MGMLWGPGRWLPFDPIRRPLSEYTTIKIGGPAYIIKVSTTEELQHAFCHLRKNGVTPRILGKGSNIIANDRGIDDPVIIMKGFSSCRVHEDEWTFEARYNLQEAVVRTALSGYSGMEHLGGIPATIGGAVYMNAGGKYGDISQNLFSVTVMDEQGDIRTLRRAEIPFRYRSWGLGKQIVLEATFKLRKEDPDKTFKRYREINEEKKRSQPLKEPSAGCVFKNGKNYKAACLIDQAGLKGFRVGGAMVSKKHANFIVNVGGATAEDVYKVIEHVIETVNDRFGVTLELEVELW